MKYVYVPIELKENDCLVEQHFKELNEPIQIVRTLEFELMTEMLDEYGFKIQVPVKRKADLQVYKIDELCYNNTVHNT